MASSPRAGDQSSSRRAGYGTRLTPVRVLLSWYPREDTSTLWDQPLRPEPQEEQCAEADHDPLQCGNESGRGPGGGQQAGTFLKNHSDKEGSDHHPDIVALPTHDDG